MKFRFVVAALAACALVAASVGPAEAAKVRPMPIGVTSVRVVPTGLNQVRITWAGGSRTTRYAFVAGSTSMTDQQHFQTGWISATDPGIRSHSYVLTVPASRLAVLGAGSGDYVFVKIVQTNSLGSPPKCVRWTPSDLCRASASGSYALAGAATPVGPTTPLTIASWNVQSVSATQDAPVSQQWSSRLPKVVRNIESAAPDLIGTQESTTARVDPTCLNRQGVLTVTPCVEQYMSLASGLSDQYAVAGPDAWQWVYRQYQRHSSDSGYSAYVDPAIYYRPDVLSVVDHGFISPYDDLGVAAFRTDDEAGAWALMRDTATGTEFLAAAMHYPVGDSTESLRSSESTALAAWLVKKSAAEGGVPVVLMADMNSYAAQDPHPAVTAIRDAGFSDAASAVDRTNARWSSTNISNSISEATGYPSVAVQHAYPTNRIDYVLTYVPGASNTVSYATRYQNVVRLEAGDARFDAAFEGSDHNMQLADLQIPTG